MKDITRKELNKCQNIINSIKQYYSERIIGQDILLQSILITLIANGHLLLESVPGLAKTKATKIVSNAFKAKFSRIQCTPDLLPSDIIGTQIYNSKTNDFETRIGPIYSNFILLDEINRSSAKTQSATLEAMQERQITIDNQIYKMPDIFIVIATQNPIEEEGIYSLSEAQLDRFLLKEIITYPSVTDEVKMLSLLEKENKINKNNVLKLDDLTYIQNISKKVYIDVKIKEYIIKIINATRNPDKYINDYAKYIELGSSPRGSISFMLCSKALALIKGREYVTPDDIKDLRYTVLRHRIILNYEAYCEKISVESIIDKIFESVDTP